MGLAPIKDPRLEPLIAEASDLARAVKAHEARIDEIKALLRQAADKAMAKRPREAEDNMVEFDSPAGVCTVIYVDETPRLASGADTDALEARFPDVRWSEVFKKRVLLRAGWQEVVARCPKAVQKALERLVDWEPSTPRVVLPK